MDSQPAGDRRLYRSRGDRVISGVCGGIAEYFGIDPTVVRLLAVILLVVGNVATLVVYIVMAIVVPEAPVGAAPASGAGSGAFAAPSVPPQEAGSVRPSDGSPAGQAVTPVQAVAQPGQAAVEQAAAGSQPQRHGAGLGLGIALIAIGGIALLATILPDVAFWQLWPLIVILVGVVQAVTPGSGGWSVHRFFDGLTTVVIGLVLLGMTLGIIGWSAWWSILTLWPLLLIAIGLDVLGKGLDLGWVRVLGSITIIGGLLYGALVLPGQGGIDWTVPSAGGVQEFSAEEPAGTVEEASLDLEFGAGRLFVGEASRGGLVTLDGRSRLGEPSLDVERDGVQTAAVSVRYPERAQAAVPGAPDSVLELGLDPDVRWSDVDLKSGASEMEVDLSGLEVGRVRVETGVSSARIRLGEPSLDSAVEGGDGLEAGLVQIKSGVSSVRIDVPSDVAVRVETQTGLVGLSVDDTLIKTGENVYESESYGTGDAWVIRVEAGVGSVEIRTYQD